MTVATPGDAGCVLRFRHGARFRCGCASSSNVRDGCDAYEDQALLCVGRLQYSTTIYSMWLLGVARQEPSHRWKMRREVYNPPTMTCMTASCFQRVFPCTKYSRVPRAIPLVAQDSPQLLPQLSSRCTQAGRDGFHRHCSIATAAREAMIGAATARRPAMSSVMRARRASVAAAAC